jgi:hypothetical protein
MIVILNEVKNLIISPESIVGILRLMPQNDIATQSLIGEGRDEGEPDPLPPHLNPLPRRGEEEFSALFSNKSRRKKI